MNAEQLTMLEKLSSMHNCLICECTSIDDLIVNFKTKTLEETVDKGIEEIKTRYYNVTSFDYFECNYFNFLIEQNRQDIKTAFDDLELILWEVDKFLVHLKCTKFVCQQITENKHCKPSIVRHIHNLESMIKIWNDKFLSIQLEQLKMKNKMLVQMNFLRKHYIHMEDDLDVMDL